MKFFLSVCLLCMAAIGSFAQSGNQSAKFNVGVEVGLPIGNYSNVYQTGLGGSLKYEMLAAKDLFVTLSAGYMHFSYTDLTKLSFQGSGANIGSGEGFVPLKAGLKYYAEDGLFFEGQLGAAFNTGKNGSTAFAYAPGMGYSFDGGLEAGIRYEAWAENVTFDQFAVRVAYRF